MTQATGNTERANRKSLKYWMGFGLTFALFVVVGQLAGEEIIGFFKSEKTPKKALSQEWITDTYGSLGLTVSTPAKLTKGELVIPDNIRQLIRIQDSYNYTSEKGFKVMINSLEYDPVVGGVNLQGAANGSINEMKMQPGVTDFSYTEDMMFKKQIPGFIQKGSYKQHGVAIEFINTGFSQGFKFWQALVAYQPDDEVGRKAAQRVIESLEIKQDEEQKR